MSSSIHSNIPAGHEDYIRSSMVTRDEREELLESIDEEDYMRNRYGYQCRTCGRD